MTRGPMLFALAVLLPGCAGTVGNRAPSVPVPFLERGAAAGVDFHQKTGGRKALDIVQVSAGGVGLLDYDGDGWLDLYLVQGQHAPGPGGGNRLYRNRGNGTFEDVTEKAGVRGHGYGMGCAVGDIDGDGWPDLYVCNFGRNELFRNHGDGTFEEVSGPWSAAVSGCSVGAVFADLDGDGWPDLYVVRYVKVGNGDRLLCDQNGVPTPCGPALYDPQPGVFLHNDRGRRFVDRTAELGLTDPGRGMSAVVSDVNQDGRLDLFVANDTTANALFLSGKGGRFAERALESGVAYGDMGVAEANMGCDVGDVDGDGRPDLFVGVMQDRMSLLFRNLGDGKFDLVSRQAGLGEATLPVVTFGCGLLDYDNDGDLDLFQANGHVQDRVHEIDPRQQFRQPRQLFENDGSGRFRDVSAAAGPALTLPAAGRGAAFGDLDNDGDVDVVVNNLDGPPLVLYNQAERLHRHWLRVRLVGKAPNTSPEGAVAELQVGRGKLLRHLHTAYSYASANDPRLHFGLGSAAAAGPLTVLWPNGKRQQVPVPGVDREITVPEGD